MLGRLKKLSGSSRRQPRSILANRREGVLGEKAGRGLVVHRRQSGSSRGANSASRRPLTRGGAEACRPRRLPRWSAPRRRWSSLGKLSKSLTVAPTCCPISCTGAVLTDGGTRNSASGHRAMVASRDPRGSCTHSGLSWRWWASCAVSPFSAFGCR